jgi:hypothetical protein
MVKSDNPFLTWCLNTNQRVDDAELAKTEFQTVPPSYFSDISPVKEGDSKKNG